MDMRSRTKSKYSQNQQGRNETGGGPPEEEIFTKVEDILEIIKKVSVNGHENVKASTVLLDMPGTSNSNDFYYDASLQENDHIHVKGTPAVSISNLDTPQPRKIPNTSDKYTNAAVEVYKENSSRDMQMREEYYAAKIKYMEARQQYFCEKMEAKAKDLLIKEQAQRYCRTFA